MLGLVPNDTVTLKIIDHSCYVEVPIVRSNAEKNNLHVAQYCHFPATSQFTHERKPWESFFLHITVTFSTRWQLTFYIKNCVKNLPVSQLFSHEIKFSRSKFSEDTSWIGLANVLHNIDVLKEYIPFETGVQTSLNRSKKNVNQQGTDSQTAAILRDSCRDIFASEANRKCGRSRMRKRFAAVLE